LKGCECYRTNRASLIQALRSLSHGSAAQTSPAWAALTAGVMDQLAATNTMKELSTKTGFSEKLTYNLINATGRALTNAAFNGGSLEDALKSALVGGLVDTAHGQAASAIKSLEADYLAHKLAHALAGWVAGAAVGGTCRDGAVGAAVGEVIAGPGGLLKPRNGMFYTEEEKRDVLAMTKLVAGATSAYAGGNAQTAITTAETAVTNNAFFVPPLVYLLASAASAYTMQTLFKDAQWVGGAKLGDKGLDAVYKVNSKDVDFLFVEYKYNTSRQGTTNDGLQAAMSWVTQSDRIDRAVGREMAPGVYQAARSGRTETILIQTLPDGRTNVKLLDVSGKPVDIGQSRLDLVQRIANDLNRGIKP